MTWHFYRHNEMLLGTYVQGKHHDVILFTDVEFKFSGTFSLNLSAGDTIKYYVLQNSGDAQNLSTPGLYIFKMIGA